MPLNDRPVRSLGLLPRCLGWYLCLAVCLIPPVCRSSRPDEVYQAAHRIWDSRSLESHPITSQFNDPMQCNCELTISEGEKMSIPNASCLICHTISLRAGGGAFCPRNDLWTIMCSMRKNARPFVGLLRLRLDEERDEALLLPSPKPSEGADFPIGPVARGFVSVASGSGHGRFEGDASSLDIGGDGSRL